jgi:hypothetical protein
MTIFPFFLLTVISASYSGRGSFEFVPEIRTDYKFRLIDSNSIESALAGVAIYWPVFYQINIRVNPCVNSTLAGGRGDLCCSGTGEVNCQDSTEGILVGPDLQIAYMQSAHVSNCEGTDFADDPNCGTFIEIHRSITSPLSSLTADERKILSDVRVGNHAGAFTTTYIPTYSLCAGSYELWWVVRTRSGPYVQLRKPFECLAPTCE